MVHSLPEGKYESESQVTLSHGDSTAAPSAEELNFPADQLPSPTRGNSPMRGMEAGPHDAVAGEAPSDSWGVNLDGLEPVRGARRRPTSDFGDSGTLGDPGWTGAMPTRGRAVSPPPRGRAVSPPARRGAGSPLLRNRLVQSDYSSPELFPGMNGTAVSPLSRSQEFFPANGRPVSPILRPMGGSSVKSGGIEDEINQQPTRASSGSGAEQFSRIGSTAGWLDPPSPPHRFSEPAGGGMCPFSSLAGGFGGDGQESPIMNKRLGTLVRGTSGMSLSSRGSALHGRAAPSSRARSVAASGTASRQRGKRFVNRKGKRAQRARKLPVYSEWEADTYIPMLKDSWARVLAVTSPEALGNAMFINLAADVEDYYEEVSPVQFVGMLSAIVEVAEDHEAVYQILSAIVVRPLAQKGASAEHFNLELGDNLIQAMQVRLGQGFTSMDKGAWEFFFSWLASALEYGLEIESGSKVTPISHSWDLAQDAMTEEGLGDLFYEVLIQLSPNLKDVFSAPRKILAMKFVEMMSTLAAFHADRGSMEQHLQWLGLRHVQYGVKPEHTQAVGEVLLATLEKAVGPDWTYEMDQAWRNVWSDACDILINEVVNGRRYGQILQEAWSEVKRVTTQASFGAILRKNLLAGTEWVQALSIMAPVTTAVPSTPSGPGAGAPGRDASSAAKDGAVGKLSKRGSLVSMQRSATSEASGSDDQLGGPELNLLEGVEKGKKGTETQAENIGTQFWELMDMLMRLMWEPENQHASLIVVTTEFFEHGTRTEHLANLGQAMNESFSNVLRVGWTAEHADAWRCWFWPKVAAAMAMTLDVMAEDQAAVVERTWERAQERCSAEDLGDLFFNSLQKYAPHVCRIFKRPKKIQAFQFVTAVGWLVTFAKEPAAFFEELKPLTVRHIKYGVKADYVKGFGQAVLNALRLAMEKEWDDECHKAWHTLWKRISGSVARSLHIGTNLIIVALVEGDLERLKDAVDCAPRKERFDLLTKVDMNGEVLSPLYWAIRDGKIAIAQFIINELLTIRADRLEYYYGRELLWKEHPDIVDVLCRDCPNLVEDFFDGLIWHSLTVVDGTVRVNYYIKELYGEPDEAADVWTSPLAMLTLIGKPNMFLHPVPSELLKIKWERFGQRIFIVTQLYFTIILILFNVGFIINQDNCDSSFIALRLSVGGLAVINTLLFSCLSISQLRSGRYVRVMRGRFCIPRFLTNPWNSTRLFSYIILIIKAFNERCWREQEEDPGPVRRKTACPGGYNDPEVMGLERNNSTPSWFLVTDGLSTFLIWIQLIQVLVLSPRLAAFTYTITRMFEDVSRNLMVISLIVISFAGTLTVLHQPYYDSLQDSILNLLKIILGLSFLELESLEGWGLFVLMFFVIIIEIGFLNILIAQLALAYEELSADKEGFAMMSRAYMVVEYESFMPVSYRKKIFREFNFDEPLEFDGGDEGPAGGIQLKQPASMRAHEKYIPDRVIRYAGEASPNDPWPIEGDEVEEIMADEVDEDGVPL